MSALLDTPIESPQQQTLPRTAPRIRHSATPDAVLRVRLEERTKPKTSIWVIAGAKAALFFMLMGVTYAASSLTGHVLVEGARQQRLDALSRAAEAKGEEAILSKALDRLTHSATIESWAFNRGFTAPGMTDETRQLLARRQ